MKLVKGFLLMEIKEEQLGPRHRNVATSLMRIGRILLDQDKPAEALEHFRRALAVEEHSMNANNPTRSVVLLDISTAALDLDDFEVARTHAQQAVELLTSAQVPPRRLAQARFILAQALWGIPAQRGRARQLAEQSAQDPGIAHIVRAWLDDHPLP